MSPSTGERIAHTTVAARCDPRQRPLEGRVEPNPGPTQRPNWDRKNHRFDPPRVIEETTPGARVCDLDAARSQANRPRGATPRNARRRAPAPRRAEARRRQAHLTALPHRIGREPSGHRSRELLRRLTTRPEPRQRPRRRFVRWHSSQRPLSRCQTSPARLSAAAPETHAGFAQWGVGWPPRFGPGTARASGRAARCRARTRPALPPVPASHVRSEIGCDDSNEQSIDWSTTAGNGRDTRAEIRRDKIADVGK